MNFPYHEQQLQFMIDLARHRIEGLDPFFRFLAYFDSPYFFFVLIPTIWLGFSYRWGLRIFYWFTLNNLFLGLAKSAFGWPRPSTDNPEIGLMHPTSNGFPSGGAEVSLFLGGLLIYYWRTRAAWVIGTIYILLISFSRLYLGVHYPLDILGGWVMAVIMMTLFIWAKDPIDRWVIKLGPLRCLLLSLAIPLALLIAVPKLAYTMGSVMGIGLGTYISLQNHLFLPPPKNTNEGIGRAAIGIAAIFLIVLLWPGGPSFAKSFTAALLMSWAGSPICKWFMQRKIK